RARGEEPGDPGATRLLYVHGLYADDADALRGEIHDMERRLLHAMRKQGVA
ncbi:sodium:proton antiporter, partial [Micrococcus endophyticus]